MPKNTSKPYAAAVGEPAATAEDPRYRALAARDARFDGQFFSAITSTGIYCRPICPARTPKPQNVRFYLTAAAAQAAGFRACKRCRPQLAPEPEAGPSRLTEDALHLIGSGAEVRQLARQLQVSERHVRRKLGAEVGASPLALTRNRRDQAARLLLETTGMPVSDVAFTAGFGSLRQFNDAIKATFGVTPSALRKQARALEAAGSETGSEPGAESGQHSGALTLRAAYRGPHDLARLLSWFAGRALAGVEVVTEPGDPGAAAGLGAVVAAADAAAGGEAYGPPGYRRTLRLAHGPAVIGLSAGTPGSLRLAVDLDDQRDLGAAIAVCRDLADLDADTVVIAEALAADPALIPLLAARPGLRIPGCADGFEMAVRAVLGQQVSVAAARTLANRIVARHGEQYDSQGPLTRLFPAPAALADGDLDGLGLTGARARSIRALAEAVAAGRLALTRHTDRAAARAALLELPGIGPWTADYLGLRALGDPDAFPAGDLVLRQAAARLGLPDTEKTLTAYAERWRPWRGYAAVHLWADQSTYLKEQQR
ncbi:MAG TPA: Ada metal-binding domain-containing protein [Actinocrinis sp.]|nr:Ada metal-binding domain-containing protein [Actinocrinis sp.]